MKNNSNILFSPAILLFIVWIAACEKEKIIHDFSGKFVYSKYQHSGIIYRYNELFVAENCTSTQITFDIAWINNFGHPVYGFCQFPRWSLDGSKIVFLHGTAGGPGNIYSIDADGQNLRVLFDDFCQRYCDHPDISPDGTKIVFLRSYDIYISPIDSTSPTLIARWGTKPMYSKVEDKIIFTSHNPWDSEHNATYYGDIYIMNGDGSNLENLTNSTEKEYAFSWSRDGNRILYKVENTLWYLDLSSRNKVFIADMGHSVLNAVWSPDGNQIAIPHYLGIQIIDVDTGNSYYIDCHMRAYDLDWN